jgi:hypothetical protein
MKENFPRISFQNQHLFDSAMYKNQGILALVLQAKLGTDNFRAGFSWHNFGGHSKELI